MIKIIQRWEKSIYKKMVKHKVLSPKVVVLMDGGICSQMHQYLLGQLFKDKGCQVVYDLSFYDEYGMDKDQCFVRNFDLLNAFPYLRLQKASELLISVYKQKYYIVGNNTTEKLADFSFLKKEPPLYLGGYYYLPANIWLPAFRSIFKIQSDILDSNNRTLYHEIESCPCSIAIHVRRGDLKVEMYDYGKPASFCYFDSAISYCKDRMSAPYFYFFSDEPDWVVDVLIPKLKLMENECKVVDINGSDKGYMDLFLIACCKHQITSKGSLGKYGALLNDNQQKIVILCDDETEYMWKDLLHNAIFM